MRLLRHKTDDIASEVVIHNGVAYLAGQVAEGADFDAQVTAIFSNMDALLAEIGSDKTMLLTVTVWLAHINDFDALNRHWRNWLPDGNKPARATAQCGLAASQFLVEVVATAAGAPQETRS